MYYRGAGICFLVYDVTNEKSFDDLLTNFIPQLFDCGLINSSIENIENFKLNLNSTTKITSKGMKKNTQNGNIPVIVMANKIDLKRERVISRSIGEKLCEEMGENFIYFESSAKEGINISEAFQKAAELFLPEYKPYEDTRRSNNGYRFFYVEFALLFVYLLTIFILYFCF